MTTAGLILNTSVQKPKILFIDDYAGSLNSLYEGSFQNQGFEVINIISGEDALDAINLYFPDVILVSEETLPIKGFELVKKIRENDKSKKLPIMMFFNVDREEARKKAISEGVNYVIVKGFIPPIDVVRKAEEFISSHDLSYIIKIPSANSEIEKMLKNSIIDKDYVNKDGTVNLFLKQDPYRASGIFAAAFVKNGEEDIKS